MRVIFHDVQSQTDLLEVDLPAVPRSNEHVIIGHIDYQVLRIVWVFKQEPHPVVPTISQIVPTVIVSLVPPP